MAKKRELSPGVCAYGRHLHRLTFLRGFSNPSLTTYFFRNRAMLKQLINLIDQKPWGAILDCAIVGCSRGAEVYSVAYVIRQARPDLNLRICAVDISEEALEFASAGRYLLNNQQRVVSGAFDHRTGQNIIRSFNDQPSSMFERTCLHEMVELFDFEVGDELSIKPLYRTGIGWHLADARSPELPTALGSQDVVIANNFLCHMPHDEADSSLRNVARLAKPGGYLFVSGVDLDLRSKVAQELGWKPVTELINEIHEGDPSLRNGWPLHHWGLEPFDRRRKDWQMRYAAVFVAPGPHVGEVSGDGGLVDQRLCAAAEHSRLIGGTLLPIARAECRAYIAPAAKAGS